MADLHIHSKYSRACSRDCDLEHLTWWARRKGITLVGTGDFTHPAWHDHLRDTLVPAEPGLFRLRDDLDREIDRTLPPSVRSRTARFMLSVEISTIYKRDGRTRKVHHLVYMPDLTSAAEFNRRLARIGNIASDGRPILGLDSRDLLEITLECGGYLVPAHVWTPWFAVLGSKSGFDAVADCYADLADHVFAVETGLSSDPEMNWRVSSLDRYRLVSNSDAHSPPALGREATVFDTSLDYHSVRAALETGVGHAGSIEFFPEEGKYHVDGHRKCGVRMEPAETLAVDGVCPVCRKPLTVGVLSRVEELADRPAGARPAGVAGFVNLVPLPEIMSEIVGAGPKSKKVLGEVDRLVAAFGPELEILQDVPVGDLAAHSTLLGEAVERLRRGEVVRDAGYDGEYGVIRLFEPGELERRGSALSLFEFAPAAAEPARVVRRERADSPAVDPKPVSTQPVATVDAGSSLLGGLDPDQRVAAGGGGGPLLIIAGPGTGKTRTLTHRIAHLVAERGVPAEECLAITFTRRAAEEMAERLEALGVRVAVATFHSLGVRILREHHATVGLSADFGIADPERQVEVARSVCGDEKEARRLVAEGAEVYKKALRAQDLVDFDDLVALPLELLEGDSQLVDAYRGRYRWISVDEYQDVDERQYRLLKLLAPADGNITAIGDPDQAIYRFRGADVGFFLRFQEDFPKARVVHLTRNYRSSEAVVRGALEVISPATLVPGRELNALGDHGDALIAVHHAASEQAEAAFVARTIEQVLGGASFHSFDSGRVTSDGAHGLGFSDFAVLYRTDRQSKALVEALTQSGLPFQKRSHDRLSDRPGVARIVRELGFTAGESIVDRVRAVAGEDHAAYELLKPLAVECGTDFERFHTTLALGVEVDTLDPRADRISLLTLHASKGLEFPVVFIVGCEDGLLPLRWPGQEDDTDEERRLLFVGMTRAQRHLFLSHTAARPRSPFLNDLGEFRRIGDEQPKRRRKGTQVSLF